MVFSDPVFVFAFLPLCLVLYWVGGWRVRNAFLIAIGAVFYIAGGRAQVLLLAASILLNYFAARTVHRWRDDRPRAAKAVVVTTIVVDVGALALWKYAAFALQKAGVALDHVGVEFDVTLNLALPIAISFYTFQCISYVIDVWRRTAAPAPRLVDFAAYILLFPHLIAGPIVRYADIETDLLSVPRRRLADFAEGAPRFFWGLGKKILIADQVAAIANQAFDPATTTVTTGTAWVGAVAFAVQIYFDFSGYSDMAIGLARMFGFHFPENFNRPYSSVSVTDFWRRWHISLSSWFRDYVYIPLGGNRRGPRRTYINLGIIFVLTGLWHGAATTFLIWGCFHGVCLIVERLTGTGATGAVRFAPVRRLITFALVCLGWVWFRASTLAQGVDFTTAMLVPRDLSVAPILSDLMTDQRMLYFALGLACVALPAASHIGQWISTGTTRTSIAFRTIAIGVVGPVACVYALSGAFSPFLYFQF